MDDKTFNELCQYARAALEPVGIIARLAFYKLDGKDIELHELEQFNDAIIDLAVEHGFECGGTMKLTRGDFDVSLDQEIAGQRGGMRK